MSILYFADGALQEFFEKIKTRPYYDDTIFVVLSDHTGGKHKSVAAKYLIPAMIYSEKLVPARKIDRFISQRDISPTVLDILGMPASRSFSGKSFWYEDDPQARSVGQGEYFADYFDSGSIGWMSDDLLVETSIDDPSEMRCYLILENILDARAIDCDDRFEKNSIRSLVFTTYSQALLFDGKTKNFFQFADQ